MARTHALAGIAAAVWLLAGPGPAAAQDVQVFADRAAFAAAAGAALPCVDFNELANLDQFPTVAYTGLTVRSTTDASNALLAIGPDSLPDLTSIVLLGNDASNAEPSPVILEFSPAVTAASLEVFSLAPGSPVSPAGTAVVLTVDGVAGSQTIPLSEGGPTFVGIVAQSGAISRITLANPAGQARFVAVDNVCYGSRRETPPPDPVSRCLDRLAAAIARGRADGTIRRLGASLESRVDAAREAVAVGNRREAANILRALGRHVRAQRGKHITPARADQLARLIQECLDRLK